MMVSNNIYEIYGVAVQLILESIVTESRFAIPIPID